MMSKKWLVSAFLTCIVSFAFAQQQEKENNESKYDDFFRQSFNVKAISSRAYNSLSVAVLSDESLVYVSDKPKLPIASSKGRFRPFVYDLASNKSKRMSTKNLCEVGDMKYHIAGLTVDDSSTFMIAALNDISQNDFIAVSRVSLVHIDIAYGFSQCATPPFVELGYTYTHPHYDSKSKYLYFSSDMPGGAGGLDIYRVKRTGNNQWGEIESLEAVNTANNDVYPFLDDEGILYFSTLTGAHGFDVFAWEEDYDKPLRLPAPINSRVDDFNFIKVDEKNGVICRSSADAESTIVYRMIAF